MLKQPRRGLLQRGDVRHVGELDRRTQVRAVLQQRRNAAIVQIEHRFEDEAREELMLRELLRAEAMGVLRQRFLRDRVRRPDHHPWRFAGLHSSA